jgi:hypothetical protein
MTTQAAPAATELKAAPELSAWCADLYGGELSQRIKDARTNFGGGYGNFTDGNLIVGSQGILRLMMCNLPSIGSIISTQKLILSVTDPELSGFDPSERIRTGLRWAKVPISPYPAPKRAQPAEILALRTGRRISTVGGQYAIQGLIHVITNGPGMAAAELAAAYVAGFRDISTDAPDHHPVSIAHLGLLIQPSAGPAAILILEAWGIWCGFHYPVPNLPIEIKGCAHTTIGSRIVDIAVQPGLSWHRPLSD